MNWKIKIQNQIKEASKQKCISSNLKELSTKLLEYDSEFILVYSGSRGMYLFPRFVDKVSKRVKIMILNEYGLSVWKILKPRK